MDGNFTCALCLDFESDNPADDHFITTECGHLFHTNCLRPAYDGGHKKCPICRKHLVPEKWRKIFGIPLKSKKSKHPVAFKDLPSTSSSSSARPTEDYDYRIKIILVGTGSVGKSSLMQRFADGTYNTAVFSTVACDWRSRVLHVGGKKIHLSIWDTAGQERHRSLVTNYVRDTHGALIVYDITDESTFNDIEVWHKFVSDFGLPETVSILIGNKTDLQADRKVDKDKGKALARKLNMYFMETSALDSYNVEAAFRTLAAKILESEPLMAAIEQKQQNPNVHLQHTDQVSDSALVSACSQGLNFVKVGFNSTVNGVKSAWKYSYGSSSSRGSSSRRNGGSNN